MSLQENPGSSTPGLGGRIANSLRMQQAAAQAAEVKGKANWELRNTIEDEVFAMSTGFKDLDKKSGFEPGSIQEAFDPMLKQLAADKIANSEMTYEDSEYRARRERIQNAQRTLKELPEVLGTLGDNMIKYKEAYNSPSGGMGDGPGQINPNHLNPLFQAMMNIENPNVPSGDSSVFTEMNQDGKGNWKPVQVAKGKMIYDINKRLYEEEKDPELKKQYLVPGTERISDRFEIDYYQQYYNANNENGNKLDYGGLFTINADIKDVGATLKKNKEVYKTDGQLKDEFAITTQVTENMGRGSAASIAVIDVTTVDANKIAEKIKPEANVLQRQLFAGGDGSNSAWSSFLSTGRQSGFVVYDDNKAMVRLYKRLPMLDSDGKVVIDPNTKQPVLSDNYDLDPKTGMPMLEDNFTQIGSDNLPNGYYNRTFDAANSVRDGLSREDDIEASRIIEDFAFQDMGVNKMVTRELNKSASASANSNYRQRVAASIAREKGRVMKQFEGIAIKAQKNINKSMEVLSDLVINDPTIPDSEKSRRINAPIAAYSNKLDERYKIENGRFVVYNDVAVKTSSKTEGTQGEDITTQTTEFVPGETLVSYDVNDSLGLENIKNYLESRIIRMETLGMMKAFGGAEFNKTESNEETED